jgi:egghead protein (zeste-white 4 protein)
MNKTPLFPFIIEVVVDNDNSQFPKPNKNLRYILVPDSYQTPQHSRYKARALHYACLHSPLPDSAWIVHLDEETQLTPSGIKGIGAMITEEEAQETYRIGQGAILYHRKLERYPFLTLADSVRTGDDLARFYFQHTIGIPFFGLHGSFIVVKNKIEKIIGFDFGPNGSITENAFWALVAVELGYRCRWVQGYLEEQSTQSIHDFIKQRRRWFQGLVKVSIHAPVKKKWRYLLGINTLFWAIAPISTILTIGHLFHSFEIDPMIRFLCNTAFAVFLILYIVGLNINLNEHGIRDKPRRLYWMFMQVSLLPAFSILESLGVLYAVLSPKTMSQFHVVKK